MAKKQKSQTQSADPTIVSQAQMLIQAQLAADRARWKREQKLAQRQRKRERTQIANESANEQARIDALTAEENTRKRNAAIQTNLQAQTGGSSPISMTGIRRAAISNPSAVAQPTFRLPTAQPMPTTATMANNPQRPFTYAPDLSRLTFGGR